MAFQDISKLKSNLEQVTKDNQCMIAMYEKFRQDNPDKDYKHLETQIAIFMDYEKKQRKFIADYETLVNSINQLDEYTDVVVKEFERVKQELSSN